MATSAIHYRYYPRTEPPPDFVRETAEVFRAREKRISTLERSKGLTSDEVLDVLRPGLETLGFEVEKSKRKVDKIQRPVFFGNDGAPTLRFEVDAYHPEWRMGMEIEAGRAWMGNAVYRDLVQAMVMVQVDTLFLAVPNAYKYKTGGREARSADFDHAVSIAEALYGHSRFRLPYSLAVLGY